jgi:FMN phosphatase YigB (HAD superfamily)
MRDFREFKGPMHLWPEVAIVPGALEALTIVGQSRTIALATNAAESSEAEIWMALGRASLDLLINKIYCIGKVGFKKPSREFFSFILTDLAIDPSEAVMVGDDFEKDILGANKSGIYAIWLNWQSLEKRTGPLYDTIFSLEDLPSAITAREAVLPGMISEK